MTDRRENKPSDRRTEKDRRHAHKLREAMEPFFANIKAYIQTSNEQSVRRLALEMLERFGK